MSALGVSESDFKRWCQELPNNQTLTSWCLETGKIGADAYFTWAKNHYGLPRLRAEFFSQEPDRALWNEVGTSASWSESLFPVGRWDGVVFIACVEPLQNQFKFPVSFVLASPSDLKNFWRKLNAGSSVSAASATPAPVEEKTFLGIPPTPNQAPPPPPIDEPAGLKLDIKVDSANNSTDFMEELSKQVAPSSEEKSVATNTDDVDTALFDMPEGLSPKMKSNVLNFTSPSVTAADAPEGLSVKTPAPSSETPSTYGNDIQILEEVSAPAATPATPGAVSSPTDSAPMSAASAGFSVPVPPEFLTEAKLDLESIMVISVQGDQAHPVIWDESFKPSAENVTAGFSLNAPSAFRVATRTRLPYLGHVVETPMNKELFTQWGFAQPPARIIVQPVIENAKVTYLILGIPTPAQKNHHALTAGEKVANLFLAKKTSKAA